MISSIYFPDYALSLPPGLRLAVSRPQHPRTSRCAPGSRAHPTHSSPVVMAAAASGLRASGQVLEGGEKRCGDLEYGKLQGGKRERVASGAAINRHKSKAEQSRATDGGERRMEAAAASAAVAIALKRKKAEWPRCKTVIYKATTARVQPPSSSAPAVCLVPDSWRAALQHARADCDLVWMDGCSCLLVVRAL